MPGTGRERRSIVMDGVFVMRRADGTLFTEDRNGKSTMPIWESEETLARYRERNPALMTWFPARLTRTMFERMRASQDATELFLLGGDDPSAELDDGRPVSLQEIFPDSDRTSSEHVN